MRSPSNRPASKESGATALQVVVVMVPVVFGLMGFAIDLGRLYVVRGELKAAANAMALAAAQRLIGTDQSTTDAAVAAQLPIDASSGFGSKYDFGGLTIGGSTALLTSSAPDPVYYAAAADALSGGAETAGSLARYAKVTLTGEAELTFWSFLPLASDRKTMVSASAIAGISAPLCTACGIEAFTVAALDATDTTNFGFVPNTIYTLGYLCNLPATPPTLPEGTQRVEYLLLNRLDPNTLIFTDENSQLFRIGAGGLPGNTNSAQGCFTINNTELIWADALPVACTATAPSPTVTSALCGITTRFESSLPAACVNIAEVDTLSTIYSPDTDINDIQDYTQYAGNGRRVITIPVVDALSATAPMTVLGFRQFLIEPAQNGIDINPSDADGRFNALYIGSVVPVKQGRFDGCQQTAGPGKVVLHQ